MPAELLKDADLSNFPNHITFYGNNFDRQTLDAEYKEYRKKWVEYPKDQYIGDFPLHLDIEVTNNCNLRCTMCFVDFTVDKGKFIDIGLFKRIVDEGSRHDLSSIKFNYRGEPMLHPQLIEMVRYAKKSGIIETQFNTNATLLDEERSEQLITAGLDKIIISIDGINPETYKKIRGADYHRVVANIKRFIEIRRSLKKKKPVVRVQMVCMEENRHEIKDFVAFWRENADQVGLLRYRWKPDEPKGKDQALDDYRKFTKPCHQLFQRLVVGCDGKVSMCCGDNLRKVIIGDVNKTGIKKLWDSDILNKIRGLHREGRFDEVAPCKACLINRHNNGASWEKIFPSDQK
ncbi:radical SAM/SPASM domain-containing protein [Candidatus Omnitrophota bacterium]